MESKTKKIRGSLAARFAAFILSALTLFSCAALLLCALVMSGADFYTSSFARIERHAYNTCLSRYAKNILNEIASLNDVEEIEDEFPNVCFEARNLSDNSLIMENLDDGPWAHSYTDTIHVYGCRFDDGQLVYDGESDTLIEVTVHERSRFEQFEALALCERFLEPLYNARYRIIIASAALGFLFVLFFSFLMASAGYRKGSENPAPSFLEKVPFDLLSALFAAAVVFQLLFLDEIVFRGAYSSIIGMNAALAVALVFAFAAFDVVCFLVYSMSFAVRCKCHILIKGCLLYIIPSFIWRKLKRVRYVIKSVILGIPHVFRCVVGVVVFFALDLVSWIITYDADFPILPIVMFISTLVFVVWTALMMRRIERGGREISNGNLGYRVDLSYMPTDFRRHAENLNRIGDGLSLAVEEKMKSERLKTELITNVSHDIKTPLTSIINYVDLLKKEKIENEKASEYIDVLDRQSARLKKLVVDLLDASRASTGNVNVNLEELDVGVLLTQAAGEYSERAEAASLELIMTNPPSPIYINADGRLIWRIIDNLMSNICKYAMPQTRVYISLEERGELAVMTFKNISRYRLNVSEEYLTERFVRGDASRSTEGSGLGLSIASDLARIQGGELSLLVDGDLFKATLAFPAIKRV